MEYKKGEICALQYMKYSFSLSLSLVADFS
jgi:hypothetical protein